MENHRRDDSPSGLSDIVEGDGLLGTGITVSMAIFSFVFLRLQEHAPPTKPMLTAFMGHK